MRRFITTIIFSVFWAVVGAGHAAPEPKIGGAVEVQVISTVRSEAEELPLSASEWHYLRHKGELRVGVTNSGLAPLEVLSTSDFKGITADVLTLLGEQLHIRMRVLLYPTRKQALDALYSGNIDLLAGASTLGDGYESIALTRSYALDIPAIYRRSKDDQTYQDDLANATIAVAAGYIDKQTLKEKFPSALFNTYSSAGQAMAAVAFGRADLYLGDSLTARYLINHSYFNYVKIERLLPLHSDGFAFALTTANIELRRIVNSALKVLGKPKLESLSRRWVGGGYDMLEDRLSLTQDEVAWLAGHPRVSVAVNDDQAPVAFVDREGNFNGIAADILDLVTQRTGLRFDIRRVDDFVSLMTAVRDGKADLSVLSRTSERDAFMRFSPPFITSTYVLLTREGELGLGRLQDLVGRRLAIAKGHACYKEIATQYPGIRLVETATSLDSLREVANGTAEAAVTSLILGRYYISKLYDGKLAVSGIVDNDTAIGNFGMRRSDVELQSILTKVILDIPPEEMNSIASRWRPNPAMTGQTWWDHRQVIFSVIVGAIALIGAFVIWALFLRLQIARRQVVEKSLSNKLRYIQILSDATPHPVYVRDRELRLIDASRSYEEAVGASLEELRGKTVIDGSSKFGAAQEMHQAYQRALEHQEPSRALRLVDVNNESRWFDHWIQPFSDAAGIQQGVLCGWMDVTDQQRQIEAMDHFIGELEQARERAEQLSSEKTHFLATMSHEIRTPLSAVIGTLELVARQAEAGKLDREGIQVAHACANDLLDLIGDVLDIVRIESGRLGLNPVRASLRDLIESVVLVFDGLARQKGLNMMLELDSSIRGDVLIDPTRFKQILSNLVSNAIKFTLAGFVKIVVQGRTLSDDKIHIDVAVSDSGIGISLDERKYLFKPFTQIRQANSGRGGAGLGLTIARSLCELMGGNLHIQSTPGKGTTVMMSLVLHQMEEVSASPIAAPASLVERPTEQGLQVLVVDDFAIHRQLLCQQLEFLGHQPTAAESGEQAFELWRTHYFDVVITDCQMPGLKGTGLAEAIRQEEEVLKRVPCMILGLTADAQREEIARSLAAGMNDCTIKPLGLDALRERLSSVAYREHGVLHLPDGEKGSSEQREFMSETDWQGVDALRALTGNKQPRLLELIRETINAVEEAMQALKQLDAHQDGMQVAVLAHQLLGIGRMLDHAELVGCCLALEQACRSQTPQIEKISVGLHDLETILKKMREAYVWYLASNMSPE